MLSLKFSVAQRISNRLEIEMKQNWIENLTLQLVIFEMRVKIQSLDYKSSGNCTIECVNRRIKWNFIWKKKKQHKIEAKVCMCNEHMFEEFTKFTTFYSFLWWKMEILKKKKRFAIIFVHFNCIPLNLMQIERRTKKVPEFVSLNKFTWCAHFFCLRFFFSLHWFVNDNSITFSFYFNLLLLFASFKCVNLMADGDRKKKQTNLH